MIPVLQHVIFLIGLDKNAEYLGRFLRNDLHKGPIEEIFFCSVHFVRGFLPDHPEYFLSRHAVCFVAFVLLV